MARVPHQPSLWKSITRSQLSSFAATLVDFTLVFALTDLLGVYYVASVALGSIGGAITNFTINRRWSFTATHDLWHSQALRYFVVSGVSLILRSGGTWALTEFAHVNYRVSVVAVSLFLGLFFNFPLQRHFVFR